MTKVPHRLIAPESVALQGEDRWDPRIYVRPIQQVQCPLLAAHQAAILPIGDTRERAAGTMRIRTGSAPAPPFGFRCQTTQAIEQGLAGFSDSAYWFAVAATANLTRFIDFNPRKRQAGGLPEEPSPGVLDCGRHGHSTQACAEPAFRSFASEPQQCAGMLQTLGDVA